MKITIVTAVYNNAGTVADCIESVLGQTYQDREFIIIDGGSTDGTLEVIERYRGRISKIFSGPDKGLYDALNRGIREATGDVVGFLHSDDVYEHAGVLSAVMSVMQDTAVDSCYGDLLYVDRDDPSRIVRYWKAGAWNRRSFLWGWMPPHPTFFVKKGVYASHGGFDLALGTSADYELMLRFLYKHRITAAYIPQVLVRMRSGGLSNASLAARLRANCMDWKAWRLNGLLPAPWTIIVKPLRKLYQYVNRPSSPEAGRKLRA